MTKTKDIWIIRKNAYVKKPKNPMNQKFIGFTYT